MNDAAEAHAMERKYAVMAYANEHDSVGRQLWGTWQQVIALLAKRDIRPGKSGKAFAPVLMKTRATRSNGNVIEIHMAVADIDTEGEKEKGTGRLVSVSKQAPLSVELRPKIRGYTWAAHSSHWHEPQRGVVKYRIVLPFSRPCTLEEWPQVWKGLHILLGGHCDPACKDASRLYYLPSCPAGSEIDAFFETNDGELLDPDVLIDLARQAALAQASIFSVGNLGSVAKLPGPPETPEEIERVKSMLHKIPANCGYEQWRRVVWAIAATGWACAEAVARAWSQTAPQKFNEVDFLKVFRAFKADGGVGFGTLVHLAKENGFAPSLPERFTWTGGDVENGRRFADSFRGRLLFVHETGDVLQFDARAGWVSAPAGEADRAAKQVLDQMRDEAIKLFKAASDDPKTKRAMTEVVRASKATNLRAMIEMGRSESGMTRSLSDFDSDPMKLGATNGVIDLQRGTLIPISPDLLVTKRCNVAFDPRATSPRWIQFLVDVQPDPAIREFLQRWVGYCLTGSVRDHKLVFLHGGGANGKSVFVELLAWLLGDYAKKVATEMLMQHQRNPQAPSSDIVSLKGMRFIYANETEEGRRLAEARVKDMTGGDTLTGRVVYGKADITFAPTHKLVLVGNHKPDIGDTSNGMWRRMCLVPFDVTIPANNRDVTLLEKLKYEGSGILNWALEGLRKYQKDGLAIPQTINAATAAYRDEEDIIGEWLGDHCDKGASMTVKKDQAYRAYHAWALKNGYRPLTKGRFTRRLRDKGFRPLPDKRTIGGLALNQEGTWAAQQ
ncbi:hypothetical protein PanNE5_18540 [Pandoraea sp. NE5]|uniref:phage/plasmid primase, P4 family n=1 Tax=Pandoraea sp. NE5 TaxID=2904129 RepID=UPI0021C4625D|nr:phage/plasmid primase, P4 family [Pandoraea sp. NE5]BDD92414.1 hypothetical protein PanNE5_18540 [Pandoraea sp. NE5]